jgi:hypothetical protein
MRLRGTALREKGEGETEVCEHVHEAVKRTRDDQRAVPIEMYGGHIVGMSV